MAINIRNTWGEAKKDISDAIESVRSDFTDVSKYITCPEIIVTSRGNGLDTITCTSSDGLSVVPETSEDKTIFKLPKYSTYTIVGKYGDYTQTEVVEVDICKQYPISLEYYSDTFANNSWDTIIDFCQRRVVPSTWKAGDSKTIPLLNSSGKEASSITVEIIGVNEDVYSDTPLLSAPLTFLAVINEEYLWNTDKNPNYRMHYDSSFTNKETNTVGWSGCDARNAIDGTHGVGSYTIPAYILNAIKAISKKTSIGGGSTAIETTSDKFWLLSASEYLGEGGSYASSNEGNQYEFFANGNLLVGDSSTCIYPLRSPDITNSTNYCCLRCSGTSSAGYKATSIGTKSSTNTFDKNYIPIGFCF